MTSISIQHLTKRYGDDYAAVDDVSLEIDDGEFMILVGPSGSGKSTLLRMIVGLENISDGDLYIGGEQVNDRAPRHRDLAMVFQDYALYPHLTVYENIAFPLRLYKVAQEEVDGRVHGVATMLELTDHLDRKPANLSGGQRQRVAMGRAVIREARAFLFDEPLSNLDAKLRVQLRTEISRRDEQIAYLPFEAPERIHRQLVELQKELDSESERTELIVKLDVASQAREGDEIQLWFDPRDLHLFDPATTENVTLERKRAT